MKSPRKPGRPKRRSGTPPTRDRLLDAAEELFYRNGIVNTGIEEVAKAADVSKMSIYQHFESKEGLVVSYLRRFNERWLAWINEQLVDGPQEPGARIVRIVELAGVWAQRRDFRGCALINAAAQSSLSESGTESPIALAARQHKNGALALLTELAREAQLKAPERLADQMMALIDGLLVGSMMHRQGDPAASATSAAKLLVEASRPRRQR